MVSWNIPFIVESNVILLFIAVKSRPPSKVSAPNCWVPLVLSVVSFVEVTPKLLKLFILLISAFSDVIAEPEFSNKLNPPPATVPTFPNVIALLLELIEVSPLNVTGPCISTDPVILIVPPRVKLVATLGTASVPTVATGNVKVDALLPIPLISLLAFIYKS